MNKKILIPIIVILVLVAGIGAYFILYKPAPQPQIGKCGDGICDVKEKANPKLCPEDCSSQLETCGPNNNGYCIVSEEVCKTGYEGIGPDTCKMGRSADCCIPSTTPTVPYSFFSVHCENNKNPGAYFDDLERLVQIADSYKVPLTIMFNPTWVDYILADQARIDKIHSWQKNGHEIALHHHGPTHGGWNGYSNMPKSEAEALHLKWSPKSTQRYIGTVENYFSKLKQLAYPYQVKSGTVTDKWTDMPQEIIYDAEGRTDGRTSKAVANFYNGHTAYRINLRATYTELATVQRDEYSSLSPNEIYGTGGHVEDFFQNPEITEGWFKFLYEKDHEGVKRKTITGLMEGYVLPNNLVIYERCGNTLCDSEEKDKNSCLQDCGTCDPNSLLKCTCANTYRTCEFGDSTQIYLMGKNASPSSIPYYFIAIHNEPRVEDLEKNYDALKQLVAKANQYNMKLTLMFTPQWADFIVNNSQRKAELENWKKQDHEIAGHHHSVNHSGVWDGYTYGSEEEALEIRRRMGKNETYLGDLNDYTTELKKLNPNIHSGCMNDEGDKNNLPDEIIYDTCSGYANFGQPRIKLGDSKAEKGKNEFISVGTVNGIERKWLTHTHVFIEGDRKEIEPVFNSMNGNVFGVVTHSVRDFSVSHGDQAGEMMKFMDFLHSKDPTGEKSRTVSEIIEQKLSPMEKEIVIE